MKRQSKAEEALRRQLQAIFDRIALLSTDRDKLTNQIEAMQDIAFTLGQEIDRLKEQRRQMSEDQKLKAAQ